MDPKTNRFIHYQNKVDDPTSISNNQIRAIYEDKKGYLWIGTGSPYGDNGGGPEDGGLNRFDKKTGEFTRYLNNPNDVNSLLSNKISSIYEDKLGVLWIGTGGTGLHRMNTELGTFERLVFDPRTALSHTAAQGTDARAGPLSPGARGSAGGTGLLAAGRRGNSWVAGRSMYSV